MGVAVGSGRGVGVARGAREVAHRGGGLAVGGDRTDEADRPSGTVLVCVDGPVVLHGGGGCSWWLLVVLHGGGDIRWLLVVLHGGCSSRWRVAHLLDEAASMTAGGCGFTFRVRA